MSLFAKLSRLLNLARRYFSIVSSADDMGNAVQRIDGTSHVVNTLFGKNMKAVDSSSFFAGGVVLPRQFKH